MGDDDVAGFGNILADDERAAGLSGADCGQKRGNGDKGFFEHEVLLKIIVSQRCCPSDWSCGEKQREPYISDMKKSAQWGLRLGRSY